MTTKFLRVAYACVVLVILTLGICVRNVLSLFRLAGASMNNFEIRVLYMGLLELCTYAMYLLFVYKFNRYATKLEQCTVRLCNFTIHDNRIDYRIFFRIGWALIVVFMITATPAYIGMAIFHHIEEHGDNAYSVAQRTPFQNYTSTWVNISYFYLVLLAMNFSIVVWPLTGFLVIVTKILVHKSTGFLMANLHGNQDETEDSMIRNEHTEEDINHIWQFSRVRFRALEEAI